MLVGRIRRRDDNLADDALVKADGLNDTPRFHAMDANTDASVILLHQLML